VQKVQLFFIKSNKNKNNNIYTYIKNNLKKNALFALKGLHIICDAILGDFALYIICGVFSDIQSANIICGISSFGYWQRKTQLHQGKKRIVYRGPLTDL
jgi:hypothetical protein